MTFGRVVAAFAVMPTSNIASMAKTWTELVWPEKHRSRFAANMHRLRSSMKRLINGPASFIVAKI
jgi:hypothetical protein